MSYEQYTANERKAAYKIAEREGIHHEAMAFVMSLEKDFGHVLLTYRDQLEAGYRFYYDVASVYGRLDSLFAVALENYLGAEYGMPSNRGELWELARKLGIYTYDVACDGVLTERIARVLTPAALAVPGFIL